MFRTAVALALSAMAAAPVSAEDTAVSAGTRVRLSTSKGRVAGTLVEQGETVVLARQRDGGTERLGVPLGDVSRFEVSQGRHGRGRGAKIGALVGLAAAVVIGVVGGESCSGKEKMICFDHGTTTLASGALTIPIGALVGAAIPPGEKWAPAPGRGLSVQPVPTRGGGVGVRLAFAF
jgi:hypothetical protein